MFEKDLDAINGGLQHLSHLKCYTISHIVCNGYFPHVALQGAYNLQMGLGLGCVSLHTL